MFSCPPPMQQALEMKLKPLLEKIKIYEDFKQSCINTEEHIKVRTKSILYFECTFSYSSLNVSTCPLYISLEAKQTHRGIDQEGVQEVSPVSLGWRGGQDSCTERGRGAEKSDCEEKDWQDHNSNVLYLGHHQGHRETDTRRRSAISPGKTNICFRYYSWNDHLV